MSELIKMWLVSFDGMPRAAYPRKTSAEVYASGFSDNTKIKITEGFFLSESEEARLTNLTEMQVNTIDSLSRQLAEARAECSRWKTLAEKGCFNESEHCPYYCMNEVSEAANADLTRKLKEAEKIKKEEYDDNEKEWFQIIKSILCFHPN